MVPIKNRIAALALVSSLAFFGISFGVFPAQVLAWDNCPKGLVNDPYPGACRRYVDANGDSICDLSQSESVASTAITTASSSTPGITQKSAVASTNPALTVTASGEPPSGDCPLGPCAGCGAYLSMGSGVSLASSDGSSAEDDGQASGTVALAAAGVAGVAAATSTTIPPSGGGDDGSSSTSISAVDNGNSGQTSSFAGYHVSPIALGFFVIYAASFALHKTKKIEVTTHRKIWNVLLLATFLITGIFGLILTIQLDYALPFAIPFDLLFWHVEAGVVMTLVSIFHVSWHFNYYRNLLRSGRRKLQVARAAERAQSLHDEQLAREARERRRLERETRRRRRAHPGLTPGLNPALTPAPIQASVRTQLARSHLPPRGRLEFETK